MRKNVLELHPAHEKYEKKFTRITSSTKKK